MYISIAELQTVTLHLNSIISDVAASYVTIDIKDYYLGTSMNRYECMLIPVKHIPEDIMLQYNLDPLVVNSTILVEIRKGIYELPQAGLIAQQRLNAHLYKHGYTPAASTPGLYIHHTRKTTFTLVVDDFGVKYYNKTDALHIINCLEEQYTITTDWTGKLYIGITLHWDYKKGLVDLSTPGYIEQARNKFTHPPPRRPQHSPHASILPPFGKEQQLTSLPDTSPFLDEADIRHVQ